MEPVGDTPCLWYDVCKDFKKMIAFAHNIATTSSEPDHDRLVEVAEGQAGCFTTAQAAAARLIVCMEFNGVI
jgi:hypothetical protein